MIKGHCNLSLVISDVGPVVAVIDAALVHHDGVKTVLEPAQVLYGVVHLSYFLE